MKNNSSLRLSVGYPCATPISFFDSIAPYLDKVGEVYFGKADIPSGRATFEGDLRCDQAIFESDLAKFSKAGVRLNLLLNGNCYGERAVSQSLADEVCATVESFGERFGLHTVTTVSPFIAYTVKSRFPDIDIRASVNAWIDGVGGMQQCADLFDSFYVKRDYNYCIDEIKREYAFCQKNGKRLYLLANSGCIPNCAYHTFHDNMIAHSKGLDKSGSPSFQPYLCRKLISKPENRYLLLSGNIIRPEDIPSYEGLVDGVKIATRIHPFPALLVRAYAKGYWDGNLTSLSEPGFADILGQVILDNASIPSDYFEKKTQCPRAKNNGTTAYCKDCGYCAEVYKSILKVQ